MRTNFSIFLAVILWQNVACLSRSKTRKSKTNASELVEAIYFDDLRGTEALLNAANVNEEVEDKRWSLGARIKPIHQAVRFGSFNGLPILKRILAMGGYPDEPVRIPRANRPPIMGIRPLTLAVQRGRADMARTLLAAGARCKNDDFNLAVSLGHDDIVKDMLKIVKLSSVEHTWLPLHTAVSDRRRKIVDLLLQKGARLDVKNAYGETVIDVAERVGYPLKWLKQH